MGPRRSNSLSGQALWNSEADIPQDVGLSFSTLKKYLWYTEKTFVLELLPPYFRNKEKEIVKAPQVYFKDLGLRNITIEKAGKIQSAHEAGFEFQNFVYRLLRKYIGDQLYTLHYWRTFRPWYSLVQP